VNENGSLYKMVDPIGAAGYSPTRPGDRSWSKIKKYDNTFVYSPGDVIEHKGQFIKWLKAIGAAGYAPDRPGDKSWKQEKTDSKKANAFTHAARVVYLILKHFIIDSYFILYLFNCCITLCTIFTEGATCI
jgi:hypothetical protein